MIFRMLPSLMRTMFRPRCIWACCRPSTVKKARFVVAVVPTWLMPVAVTAMPWMVRSDRQMV